MNSAGERVSSEFGSSIIGIKKNNEVLGEIFSLQEKEHIIRKNILYKRRFYIASQIRKVEGGGDVIINHKGKIK